MAAVVTRSSVGAGNADHAPVFSDRPVMLQGWHAAEAASLARLEANHQYALRQHAQHAEAQAVQIARLHEDLFAARSKIAYLTTLLTAAGAYCHDEAEMETP